MAELQDLADRAGAYRLMILVLGLCGLRFGECAALRVRSVDLMRRRLRVSESVSEVNGHLIWSTPKTHQSRDVPIPRSLIDALVAQACGQERRGRAVQQSERRAHPAGELAAASLGPGGRRGRPRRALRRTTSDTPPRPWRSRSGASVKHVQRMLGHKDAAMTLNVYASLFEDDLDAVSDRLDAALPRSCCGLCAA